MLSIIIPTSNEEKYLPLLLEQIKKQNFSEGEEDKSSSSPIKFSHSENEDGKEIYLFDSPSPGESSVYEIIIADAGSTDKTIEIAKSFGCKIASGGLPAKGRNEGAKIAQGDIFLFMDADNIFLPENFLKNLLGEFEKRNLGVASFPICPKGNGFDKLAYRIYNFWTKLTQNFLPHATNSVLVKREVFEKIGGFDEEIKIGEDHEFVRRAAKFEKFGFIEIEPVLTLTRRFERDGRIKTYLKYLFAGIYMLIFGPIKSDIFKYRFTPLEGQNFQTRNSRKGNDKYNDKPSNGVQPLERKEKEIIIIMTDIPNRKGVGETLRFPRLGKQSAFGGVRNRGFLKSEPEGCEATASAKRWKRASD